MITPTELYFLLKSIEVQRVAIIVVPLNFKQRLFMSVLIVIPISIYMAPRTEAAHCAKSDNAVQATSAGTNEADSWS